SSTSLFSQASLWSEAGTLTRQEKDHEGKQTSSSTPVLKESNLHRKKSKDKRENYVQKTSIKTSTQKGIHPSIQSENILQKKRVLENSVQTDSGLVTVRESDIQLLADLLKEALWREEVVKKKLAALQGSTTNLLKSSTEIWTARCSEDLLRNKIEALEAQLQVCLQKFPNDGVKKVVIQMEKQKRVYEEKALEALQKATLEKTDALIKTETLQEELSIAKAEAMRWQSLYEDLKLSSGQLRENQHLSNDQLQQLHSQLELFRAREAELMEEVVSLRQEMKEQQYNISLLEDDNQMLREEIQHIRGKADGCFFFFLNL
uniref:TRAF3-interacting JNK-activating modulator-like n=1 Tax=Labrus bergylta TaxID=56723 RepID=A0A3Q3MZ89_9LABR